MDDPAYITECFNLFRNKLTEERDKLIEMYPNTVLNIIDDDRNFKYHTLELTIPVSDLTLNVTSGGQEPEDNVHIANIDYGQVDIKIAIVIFRFFNKSFNYIEDLNFPPTHNVRPNTSGYIKPKYKGTLHPYVSRSYQGDISWQNVCMGNMTNEILQTFSRFDWTTMGILIGQWLSNFKIGITGPLNQISESYIGQPMRYDNTGLFDLVGITGTDNCWSRQLRYTYGYDYNVANGVSLVTDQCDEVSCTLRDTCHGYRYHVKILDNVRKVMDKLKDRWKFDCLLPTQQTDSNASQTIYYALTDTFECMAYDEMTTIFQTLQLAIDNGKWDIVKDMIKELVNLELFIMWKDITEAQESMFNFLINSTWDEVLEWYESIKVAEDSKPEVTDEQEQMIMWAQSQNTGDIPH
jgi:hypothetical protein